MASFLDSWFSEEPDHSYKAKWGDISDYTGYWNLGFAIGSRAFTKSQSHLSMLVAGPSGAGKGSKIIIPSLASLARGRSSIVILDVSSENWKRTSKFFKKLGYCVIKIDFSSPIFSWPFNYLIGCSTISDIIKGVTLLHRNTNGITKGDIFWEQNIVSINSVFGRYLCFHADRKYRSIQNILRFLDRLSFDPSAVDRLFSRIQGDEDLLSNYKSIISMNEKTLSSVISSARASLNLWTDPSVCACTSGEEAFDFSILHRQPTIIYCTTPIMQLAYYKPLICLFFQSVFNYIMAELPDDEETTRSIFVILDEFGSSWFPNFSTTISSIRKYLGGCLICTQDENVINSLYGDFDASQIKTNCGIKAYLKNTPLHTATELSKIMGKYSYKDERNTEHTRELMTPSEIRMCEDIIVLVTNQPPIRYDATSYFKSMRLQHLKDAKGLELEPRALPEKPHLIPFD